MPQRSEKLRALRGEFDVLIIGGGATGLGIAVDASTRGYRTALVEAGDFAQATSSRATKLVHGGVRYLANGQMHLVYEALRERKLMMQNAPHLVHPLAFVTPAYRWFDLPFYGAWAQVVRPARRQLFGRSHTHSERRRDETSGARHTNRRPEGAASFTTMASLTMREWLLRWHARRKITAPTC